MQKTVGSGKAFGGSVALGETQSAVEVKISLGMAVCVAIQTNVNARRLGDLESPVNAAAITGLS